MARDRYFLPRSNDPSLQGAEQALSGEAANACDRAINALGAGDLWPTGQRNARWADCTDKVFSLATVDSSHFFSNPTQLYNGMDLLRDAADASHVGLTTFLSNLGGEEP